MLERFEEWYQSQHGNMPVEQFEALERERVRNDDPDSLAFFNSRKLMTKTRRATKSMSQHAMAKKRSMQR